MEKSLLTEIVKRPALRYHGGKWLLAPWILQNLPDHRIYVEPFGGAASVLLRKERSYAEVYNDKCGDVVNLFKVLRDRGDILKEKLYNTPYSRDEFLSAYEVVECPLEQARRMVIRSYMGFGSGGSGAHYKTGFRSNSNRSGSTPAHDWANFPGALDALISRLRGVVIENKDANALIKQHDSADTLFYVDPPYVLSTRNSGKVYPFELSDQDHIDLAVLLHSVEGRVVISGYRCALYDILYYGWRRVDKVSKTNSNKRKMESLWISPSR